MFSNVYLPYEKIFEEFDKIYYEKYSLIKYCKISHIMNSRFFSLMRVALDANLEPIPEKNININLLLMTIFTTFVIFFLNIIKYQLDLILLYF
jgi:hypothetical protein